MFVIVMRVRTSRQITKRVNSDSKRRISRIRPFNSSKSLRLSQSSKGSITIAQGHTGAATEHWRI